MIPIFNAGVEERLKRSPLVLELGCGEKRSVPDAVTLDKLVAPSVDIVCDLDEGIPLPDSCADEIFSRHFLEHVRDLAFMMKEIERTLKPGGRMTAIVPHFANPFFYSDYTHSAAFGLHSMSYFDKAQNLLRRRVPKFYNSIDLRLEKTRLAFTSERKIMRSVKRVVGKLVNASTGAQEFFEEHCCYLMPPYEIHFEMRKPWPEERKA